MYRKKTFRIESVRTNWTEVEGELENEIHNLYFDSFNTASASEKYAIFTKIVSNAIKNYTPKKRFVNNKIHRNPVYWWDAECDKVLRLRKAAYKKFTFSGIEKDYVNFKKHRAIAKKTFKNKKRECYIKFVESINNLTNKTYVWNKSKILKNKWVKIKPNHNPENHQESARILEATDKICPPWCSTDPEWIPDTESNEFLSSIFTFAEFNLALDNKNSRSSPGLDGIDYQTIKNLPNKYKLILLDIFNEMYVTNSYPLDWKNTYVHFVKKNDNKSIRPISLTSSLCKLFETLIKNKLQFWVETQNILPPSQSGFRKGQSTCDNVTNFLLFIEESFSNKKDVLAAFLDVQGAFDNVNIDLLLTKLADIGCPYNLIKFVKHICTDRHIFTVETESNYQTANKGLPQGGVLSPLLYCIYVAAIINNIPSKVNISQFADDLVICSSFSTVEECRTIIESSVLTIYK